MAFEQLMAEAAAKKESKHDKKHHHKIQLLMRFATEHESATIPDPYYGSPQGFEQAADYIEDACNGLLEVARRRATQVAAA